MCKFPLAKLFFITTLSVLTVCGCGTSVGKSVDATPADVTLAGATLVRLASATQLVAQVSGPNSQSIIWQVDGVTGGSAETGVVSSTGVYTAPSLMPATGQVNISAISQANPQASASLVLSLENPIPVISTASANQVGTSNVYNVDIVGSGFVPGSTIVVGATNFTSNYQSISEVNASLTITSGTQAIQVSVVNPNPGSATSNSEQVAITNVLATTATAGRLLDQSSFGPAKASIQHVQKIGVAAYLQEQFSQPATQLALIPTTAPFCGDATISNLQCADSEWWQATLTAPDQLRRRVAFALSEIFVVGGRTTAAQWIPVYDNLLTADAFGNFAELLHDVTLSPAMGLYLNMFGSAKGGKGYVANENFARELMQLFTLGPNLLNQDGSLQLDATGNPIPTYTQDQVDAFARVFTGWSAAPGQAIPPCTFSWNSNLSSAMVAVECLHDGGSKTVLNDSTLPSGQTAAQDLADSLSNIFNHPNLGPFISKQLIQHLVTSTPSPSYIARVAATFADNGSGVRGDMQAVIAAILTDPEARAGDSDPTFDGGRLREPILFMSAALRSLESTNNDPGGLSYCLSGYSEPMGETPYGAPSVFNFFPSNYIVPQTQINAPEFGLENNANYLERLTVADNIVRNGIFQYSTNLSDTSPLGAIAQNPAELVHYLSLLFMHDQMPDDMQTAIVDAITPLTSPAQRARVAVYLVITSPQYLIIH